MWDQYDEKFARHGELEQMNQNLQQQFSAMGSSASNSKDNVLSLLNQKVGAAEKEAKNIEKSFLKTEIDLKSFLDEYIKKRVTYHQYQVLKVKVQ